MKCEAVQNRLLAAPDAHHPEEKLLAHLADCSACRMVQTHALKLDSWLLHLPAAPSSDVKKAAFLESIQEAGPIIRVKPRSLRTPSGTYRPWQTVLGWEQYAGIAAALMIALGGLWWFTRTKSPVPELAEKPRHELLKKEVRHLTQLANSDSAPKRMTIWAEWASDLKTETKELYKVAPNDDLQSLGRLFERAVQEGIVKQAGLLDKHMPAGERQALFQDALARLTEVETETAQLSLNAPPDAQKTLRKMSQTAKTARVALEPLVKGV